MSNQLVSFFVTTLRCTMTHSFAVSLGRYTVDHASPVGAMPSLPLTTHGSVGLIPYAAVETAGTPLGRGELYTLDELLI
jgi:hypothetical protein